MYENLKFIGKEVTIETLLDKLGKYKEVLPGENAISTKYILAVWLLEDRVKFIGKKNVLMSTESIKDLSGQISYSTTPIDDTIKPYIDYIVKVEEDGNLILSILSVTYMYDVIKSVLGVDRYDKSVNTDALEKVVNKDKVLNKYYDYFITTNTEHFVYVKTEEDLKDNIFKRILESIRSLPIFKIKSQEEV